MKFHVNKPMNLLALAKERCANWNDSNDRCFGWSVEYLGGGKGTVEERDHCRLKDGQPCEYFEHCVIAPMVKKEDSEALFHYRRQIERIQAKNAQNVVENKGVKIAKISSPSNSVKTRKRAS